MSDTVIVNTDGIDRLLARVRSLESIDFSPLMEEWRGILETDNQENLGIDGYGIPMIAVTYRPDPKAGSRKPIDFTILTNDNLTSGHYRTLDGPPLSPQGAESRITTKFRTRGQGPTATGDGTWRVLGSWEDFLSVDGREILPFHADGPDHNPKLPIRDVLHVRPSAVSRARDALIAFVQGLLRRTP